MVAKHPVRIARYPQPSIEQPWTIVNCPNGWVKAVGRPSREEREVAVIARQIDEMKRTHELEFKVGRGNEDIVKTRRSRAKTPKRTPPGEGVSGGDSKDATPCSVTSPVIASSHEHETRLVCAHTPEVKALATLASSEQVHKHRHDVKHRKDIQEADKKESDDRIVQYLLAND